MKLGSVNNLPKTDINTDHDQHIIQQVTLLNPLGAIVEIAKTLL